MSPRAGCGRGMRRAACAMAVMGLAGCATWSSDGGLDAVSGWTQDRIGAPVVRQALDHDPAAWRAQFAPLLAQPLTAESAMRIALLNNRGWQAALAELGVAEADLVQAGRLRNPGLSFSRLRAGDAGEIDRGVVFDLAGLLTLPLRRGIAERRFEQAKLEAAAQAIRLATETRKAYYHAIAAEQAAQYRQRVAQAAHAGAELAQRMARVGNRSLLEQWREEAFDAEASAQWALARHTARAAREQLTRLLGLWGADLDYTLPARLPDVPAAPRAMPDAEAQAMTQRLDLQVAKRDTEATARALGLNRITRVVNVLDAGYIDQSVAGQPRADGYEITFELPLFDWGDARVAKAEALYLQAVQRTSDLAVRARSDVRTAYSAYRTAYELATHYRDHVVPLQQKILDEVLLRYNGMLASVFELLSEARAQSASVNAAIDAQRDFWLADADLHAAVSGGGSGPSARGRPASALVAPEH